MYKINNAQIRTLLAIDEFLNCMLRLQLKGNTFEHTIIIKTMAIRDIIVGKRHEV